MKGQNQKRFLWISSAWLRKQEEASQKIRLFFFLRRKEMKAKERIILVLSFVFFASFLFAQVPSPKREYTYTKDGVRLVFFRYARLGQQPVILVHGLAQNGMHFDLPVPGYSLAKYLYAHGFDVWVPNLRGHGRGRFASETPKKSWTVDDFAIYDVPAIVNKVYQATGKRPFYIGFSMGGMIAYMYLQGVYYHPKTERVVSSFALALKRNEKIKGLITIASPVTMSWKKTPGLISLLQKEAYYDYNLVLDRMPGRRISMYSFSAIQQVPLRKWLNWSPVSPCRPARLLWIRFLGKRFPFSFIWYSPNMTPRLMDAALRYTLDNVSGKVLAQFTHWCIYRTFCEYSVGRNLKEAYSYARGMYKIFCPLFIIAGDRDKLVCDDVLYQKGFLQVSSIDKTFRSFQGFGHLDLCLGVRAPKVVYPAILRWLNQRRHISRPGEEISLP